MLNKVPRRQLRCDGPGMAEGDLIGVQACSWVSRQGMTEGDVGAFSKVVGDGSVGIFLIEPFEPVVGEKNRLKRSVAICLL